MLNKMFQKKLDKIQAEAKSRFRAQVVADSVSPDGKRITTFLLRYPRFIAPEVLTHKVLSKSSSSGRAIPSRTLRRMVLTEPMLPVEWGANNPGMQSKSLLPPYKAVASYYIWLAAAMLAAGSSFILEKLGVHKQIVNRLTEFAQPVNVVITGTEWANFFALRYHPAAQPEFQYLAKLMYEALISSTPTPLQYGDWHLPFVDRKLIGVMDTEDLIKISVARCARTSYRTHDGRVSSLDEDLELYERLMGHNPKHASPAEMQAQCVKSVPEHLRSNLFGWIQYRKTLKDECIKEFGGI